MKNFRLFIESDLWNSVVQHDGQDVIMIDSDELYDRQNIGNKKLIDRMKIEDENYLKTLTNSIKSYGFKQPIIVRQDYQIDDGLHRLIVALSQKIEKVPMKFKQ